MKIFFFLLVSSLLFSCNKNKRPDAVLPPEKMQLVLWDYISADIYASNYLPKDSSINVDIQKQTLQEKVFQKNKTTKNIFNESYTWYQQHGDAMQVMLDSMITKKTRNMEKERIETYKAKSL